MRISEQSLYDACNQEFAVYGTDPVDQFLLKLLPELVEYYLSHREVRGEMQDVSMEDIHSKCTDTMLGSGQYVMLTERLEGDIARIYKRAAYAFGFETKDLVSDGLIRLKWDPMRALHVVIRSFLWTGRRYTIDDLLDAAAMAHFISQVTGPDVLMDGGEFFKKYHLKDNYHWWYMYSGPLSLDKCVEYVVEGKTIAAADFDGEVPDIGL